MTEEAKSQLPVKRRSLVVTGTMTLAATPFFAVILKDINGINHGFPTSFREV